MSKTDFNLARDILQRQEELLQFDHFNTQDVWELGKLVVEEIFARGIDMSICIRQINGRILFQYGTENTSLNNQNWMQRKFNTVCLMESSSLSAAVAERITGEDVPTHGLNPQDYVFCGGGFPVRIKGSGVTAVVLVSNLPHVQDHAFLVDFLSRYLGVTDVPVLDMEI